MTYDITSKWPQMLVTGQTVTDRDTIIEILLLTDSFLTDTSQYSGGNNHAFNLMYRTKAGLEYVGKFERYIKENNITLNDDFKYFSYEFEKLLKAELGVIDTEYVSNRWASSCFIYGAYGWCSPEGKILYTDNVGKWPSTEEIVEEWEFIAKKWSFLNINVTLFDGESCEDNKNALFNLVIKDGTVEIKDPDTSVHCHLTDMDSNFNQINRSYSERNEQGVPDDMIDEIASIVKNKVHEVLKKIPEKELVKYMELNPF